MRIWVCGVRDAGVELSPRPPPYAQRDPFDGASIPDDHIIVLFGALGDLSTRKLLPGLFHLDRAGLMPANYRIIGTSRKGGTAKEFGEVARKAVGSAAGDTWEHFAPPGPSARSAPRIPPRSSRPWPRPRRSSAAPRAGCYYLSIPPNAFGATVEALGTSGLSDRSRVVLEKPFGVDLESAIALNKLVHGVFPEERVFRIDHFLGREAVQNLIALRFANGMFEPIWNKDHIDHVQIDVPETLAVEGRAGFYEGTGAYRDMVVTHLFHVLGFVAMEPPTASTAARSSRRPARSSGPSSRSAPNCVIRGQYAGYREGEGVDPDSQTETFIAMRAEIDNWRWSGVPFFLRTGKQMGESRRLLTIAFREPPRRMFKEAGAFVEDYGPDHISFDFGDPGGITTSSWPRSPGRRCARPGADGVHLRAARSGPRGSSPTSG